MSSAQKIKASTQKFIEIQDIREDIVLLNGGNACLIIEVQATNFALLSQEEQRAKIFAYSSLLNSLSFPIQILIRSKRVDISSYIKLLDHQGNANLTASGENKKSYIKQYRNFVQELIKVNTVLDKTFYVILTFSALEKGPVGMAIKKDDFFAQAKAALHTKSESLLNQFQRLTLRSTVLKKDALTDLFYNIYNTAGGEEKGRISSSTEAVFVSGKKL